MNSNPQLDLAYSFVNDTNCNVYLTGKAGTGKTTFLHRVKEEVSKRTAVVAPTGVAAINAKGVTIHSLFQLPFGPNVPGTENNDLNKRRFSKNKINLIKSLDLLIIDEISMVRADVLDAIDAVLRRFRGHDRPFGGLQLLMIGDLHQLPPVVNSQEWNLLREHYKTPYFFGSHALNQTDVVHIELKYIYRQDSKDFISLLNKVRNDQMDQEVLQQLNSRYIPDFEPTDEEGYVTLTSHNKTAQRTNSQKLKNLSGEAHHYEAEVDGDFPEHAYPTAMNLELKKDAQVMFVKNDPSEDKLFYNGKIGKITVLEEDRITVQCPEDDEEIEVEALTWENRKFQLNESTKEVEEQIIGTFKQFPLKLAWAITIHKSQGLTFERLVIDAADAFAHGQVYVALSRCKSFEGIVLRSRIEPRSVQTDQVVQGFTKEIQENEPGEEDLRKRRHNYQCEMLRDLFTFSEAKRVFGNFDRVLQKHHQALVGEVWQGFQEILEATRKNIFQVGNKFLNELQSHFEEDILPEENGQLQERLQKAGEYFLKKLKACQQSLEALEILSDNKDTQKTVTEKKTELEKELHELVACFQLCEQGFESRAMARAKADAEVDFQNRKQRKSREREKKSGKKYKLPEEIEHQDLFQALMDWRKDKCTELDVPAYRVISTKAIVDIAQVLPTQVKTLTKVNGIGKVKAEQYGDILLEMVKDYCDLHELTETDRVELATGPAKKDPAEKKNKKDTKQATLELYQAGKTLKEIADERGLAQSTIQGHLSHFIGEGVIDIHDLLSREKVEHIATYFEKSGSKALSEAKAHFGQEVGYGDLQLVLAHWGREKRKS